MVKAPAPRTIRIGVAGALIVGLSCGCAGLISALPGCSDRNERFAATLANLPILMTHPDGATPTGSESGCDVDSGFASAGRQYRAEMSREGILSFYRTAAADDGWQAVDNPTPAPPKGLVIDGDVGCFQKEIDGTTARLDVWFPSDFNALYGPELQEPEGAYGIDVYGSHDDDAEC
ncbi:hypothetical protein AB0C29_13865 [Actinoplanes sp. NPDC048791]|uniref:hypothetical protein n=1 Tax=Actinoplanes sp. NPDC048791 TaxID=3154623 RepID=UPI0033E69125